MEYVLLQAMKLNEGLDLTPTPQHFQHVNVTYHQLKIKRKPFEIPFIGDTHIANQECLEDFLQNALDRIKKTRNVLMLGMGDFAEFNNTSSPGYAIHEQKYTNDESKDRIEELFKPIRKKIGILHDGNHDGTRSRIKVGTSQTKDIAKILDVPYCKISCYHVIDFNNHRIIIYTNHGKNRATPKMVGTRRKTWEESMIYKQADIIAIGHIHRLIYEDINPNENITENVIIDYENQKMKTIPARFPKRLITGHFLEYLDGYGQENGYPPNPAGYPILKLYPDGCYDVEKVYERDWRNKL